jgi:signal transduction histidine kinase
MRIGILTGGGDVPGLNACIKAAVTRVVETGHEVMGIRRGWRGLLSTNLEDPATIEDNFLLLDRNVVRTVDRTGGTFLHTSRTNPSNVRASEVPDRDRLAFSVNSVSRQADKLSRLITQLLDISRFEAGKLPIETQKVDLPAFIHDVVAGAHSSQESHSIVISAPEALVADIDPLRFEQVLSNLLNNAVRYSPDGGTITISLRSPESNLVELSIRDRGLGIPPEKRDRIFERFYQAHQHESRSGMGLGLYISRQIVRMHGGELFAEFPEDGGTCFVIRLPAHASV